MVGLSEETVIVGGVSVAVVLLLFWESFVRLVLVAFCFDELLVKLEAFVVVAFCGLVIVPICGLVIVPICGLVIAPICGLVIGGEGELDEGRVTDGVTVDGVGLFVLGVGFSWVVVVGC